jgi:hypothetical protein
MRDRLSGGGPARLIRRASTTEAAVARLFITAAGV